MEGAMRKFSSVVSVLVLALAAGQAMATPIIKATSGLAAPAQTLTFDPLDFATNTVITNQYQTLFGVSFSSSLPGLYYTPVGGTPATQSGGTIGNYDSSVGSSSSLASFSMQFSNIQTAVAFAVVSQGAIQRTWNMTARLLGINVDTTGNVALDNASNLSPNLNNDQWYGFTGVAGGFDEIVFTRISSAGNLWIDNIQMSVAQQPPPPPGVPAPASFALMGLGMLGLARLRRRTLG
jgi:MYXO-CTERM domain-containing protein